MCACAAINLQKVSASSFRIPKFLAPWRGSPESLRINTHKAHSKSRLLAMVHDIAIRGFLNSWPEEYIVTVVLLKSLAAETRGKSVPPVDSYDGELLGNLLVHRLSSRRRLAGSMELFSLRPITEYTLGVISHNKRLYKCSSAFRAAFDRLWYELDFSSQDVNGEFWEEILFFANLMLYSLMYVPSSCAVRSSWFLRKKSSRC